MDPKILLNNAELAMAAYANLSTDDLLLQTTGLQEAGFSAEQAANFASNYNVVTQYDDKTETGETSFNATVFKDESGQLTLAIRGTLELADIPGDIFPTDANILLHGAGYDQIVAMVNWWQRVSAPEGSEVEQYQIRIQEIDLDDSEPPPAGAVLLYSSGNGAIYLESAPSIPATGELYQELQAIPDQTIDVTGHSLGGHLAQAFNALFPDVTGDVTTFNAPGFKDTQSNRDFFAMLGGQLPLIADNSNVTNIIADQSTIGEVPFDGIAGLHTLPGETTYIAIEDQAGLNSDEPFSQRPRARNHSQQILTDSLAVYDLLTTLDPNLGLSDYRRMLNQSVIGTAGSYEGVVDVLAGVFGTRSAPLPVGNTERDALYDAIYELAGNTRFQTHAGSLTITPLNPLAIELKLQAEGEPLVLENPADAIAYRYALVHLNPFVITGNADLYNDHNNDDRLELYNPATGEGHLTESYLEDRATVLDTNQRGQCRLIRMADL